MKLYIIHTQFWGKDLNEETILEYKIAENDEEIYQYINNNLTYWEEDFDDEDEDFTVSDLKTEIMKDKGDHNQNYNGEFYDQKYRWEEVSEITPEEIKVLKKFKIL